MNNYTKMIICGPWYKVKDRNGNIFMESKPGLDTKSSDYSVANLKNFFPYILPESILETKNPPMAFIRVPNDKFELVKSTLKHEGFMVA